MFGENKESREHYQVYLEHVLNEDESKVKNLKDKLSKDKDNSEKGFGLEGSINVPGLNKTIKKRKEGNNTNNKNNNDHPSTAEIRAKNKEDGGTGMSNISPKEGNAKINNKEINPNSGKETQVREAIGKIEMVEQRWGIFGEFDVLVKVVADDEIDLTRCIMEEIRIIDGILDTRTLIGSQI